MLIMYYIREVVYVYIDSLCRGGGTNTLNKQNGFKPPKHCCCSLVRHISVSASGSVPNNTLKVHKIIAALDIHMKKH